MKIGKLELFVHENRSYIQRYVIVRTPTFRVYCHNILRPDREAHSHNHPWEAISLILCGGYDEEVPNGAPFGLVRRLRAGLVNRLRRTHFHRIVRVLPDTWTLVLGWGRLKPWMFYVDGVEVPSDLYLPLLHMLKKGTP